MDMFMSQDIIAKYCQIPGQINIRNSQLDNNAYDAQNYNEGNLNLMNNKWLTQKASEIQESKLQI